MKSRGSGVVRYRHPAAYAARLALPHAHEKRQRRRFRAIRPADVIEAVLHDLLQRLSRFLGMIAESEQDELTVTDDPAVA